MQTAIAIDELVMTDVGCAIDTGAFNQRTAGMCNGCRGRVTRMWIEAMSKSGVRAARSRVLSLRVKTTAASGPCHLIRCPWPEALDSLTILHNKQSQLIYTTVHCIGALSIRYIADQVLTAAAML